MLQLSVLLHLCIDSVGDLVFGDGSEEQALVLLYLVSQYYCQPAHTLAIEANLFKCLPQLHTGQHQSQGRPLRRN